MPTFHLGPGERWAFVSALAYTAVNITLRLAAPKIDPALGSLLRLLPLTVIAFGVVLASGARELRPHAPEFLGWRLVAALGAVGAGTTYALANVLSRYVQVRRPVLFVTLAVSNLGGLVPLTLIVVGRAATGEAIAVDAPSAGAVLAAGLANAVALASLALAVRSA